MSISALTTQAAVVEFSVDDANRVGVPLVDPYGFQPAVYGADDEADFADSTVPQVSEYCQTVMRGQGPTSECCWCREKLLGDLYGTRSKLAQCGIIWDGQLTQFYQGVADGGNEQTFRYGGKLDQFVIFNFAQMGLGQHLTAIMHVETKFGENVVRDAVLLAPVNANLLYPKLDENDTAITALQFELALSEQWFAAFGKFNALDLQYLIYPQTGRGVDGFMNISLLSQLTLGRTLPLSFLGAGLIKKRGQQIQGAVLVYDSHNITTTSGFDDLFDNGANILGYWRHFTDWRGKPGSHAIVGTWASGDFTSLDPLGWAIIPGQGVVAPEVTGSWSIQYVYEQKLWLDPCNQNRNIGLFSQLGYADQETSPFEWIATVSLQAYGFNCCRPNDSLGAGYFFSGLSGDLRNLLQPVVPVNDLHGVELYYNAQIAPWFHLTADLQVVEPAVQANDTAIVAGLRAKVDF